MCYQYTHTGEKIENYKTKPDRHETRIGRQETTNNILPLKEKLVNY